ncbi:MAG: hypothetical protein LBB65_08415 [Burkholderiales bacterium]|nr:hypothetical protein [Burkholderiales bacterium]
MVFQPDKNRTARGLREELLEKKGIYLFYDSRGKVLYVGKTKSSIWKEMHYAYKRPRKVQVISAVKYPERRDVSYKSAQEKKRKIEDVPKTLFDLAAYFSAYEINDDLIDDFEALFIRAFPNDLLNSRVEKFTDRRE